MPSEFVNEKLPAEILSKVASLREFGTFCDVILEADSSSKAESEPTPSTSIRAHKFVLAAASPYFRKRLSSGSYTKQTTTNEIHILVDDIDDETLRVLADYIYTGLLDINERNVRALFGAANVLQLDSVLSECSRYLMGNLSISNWMETAAFAKTHNCTELDDAAVLFARRHFGELVKSEELMSMDESNFLGFISDDRLNPKDEVFKAVINWVKHDLSRQPSLPNILPGVRLPLMSREFLLNRVCNEPMIRESPACMVMLGTVFHDMLSEKKTSGVPENWYRRPHTPTSKMIMVAGGEPERSSFLADVNIYDSYSQQWTSAAPLLHARSGFGMATVRDSIYAVGGRGTSGILPSVEIYDSQRNSWRAGPKMQYCRHGLGVATLNRTIFAVGGFNKFLISGDAEMLDPRQGKWISLPKMKNGRMHFGLAAVNGLLYAAGGRYENQFLNSVEVYDPRACRWTTAQPMPKERWQADAAVFRDQIVVVGGVDDNGKDLPSAEMLTDNGWTFLPEMSLPREGLGVVNVDGSLFAFGGSNRDGYLSCVEYLDFDSNQWEMSQIGMPQKNAYFGITHLP
ncbi:hypothetical protein Q1695_011332 [Nippostrongylus brasiliensis]|nr:hypothetical protein Q1695_011332 [Nippostrongylus brasiliensis]